MLTGSADCMHGVTDDAIDADIVKGGLMMGFMMMLRVMAVMMSLSVAFVYRPCSQDGHLFNALIPGRAFI